VCGFEAGGEWIGTIRIVPLGYGLTLTENLMPYASGVPAVQAGDWEVGRLVLAPDCRADVHALRQCLRVALEYGFDSADIHHLYATCSHVLSRLYRRFGFTEVARGVVLPGTQKEYTLIRGSAATVATGLASKPAPLTQ
jgi:predicted GNAT family N-acyltransferase